MNLHPLDLAIIAAYIVATVGIGFWISRKASKSIQNYFLGGNEIPWYALGLSNASGMFDISGTMWRSRGDIAPFLVVVSPLPACTPSSMTILAWQETRGFGSVAGDFPRAGGHHAAAARNCVEARSLVWDPH